VVEVLEVDLILEVEVYLILEVEVVGKVHLL